MSGYNSEQFLSSLSQIEKQSLLIFFGFCTDFVLYWIEEICYVENKNKILKIDTMWTTKIYINIHVSQSSL